VDAAAREAILADWKAESAIPVPPDTSQIGCAAAILAAVLAAGVPAVLRALHVTLLVAVGAVLLGTFAVIFAWGVFRGMTGKAKGFNAVAARAAEALGRLSTHPDDRGPEARRAAVALIHCAFFSNGPSLETTFEFDPARERLGSTLPFVMDVEKVLLEAGAYPVFTKP